MAAAFVYQAFGFALLCIANVQAEVELGIPGHLLDDVCEVDDAECALSLRQLRGEPVAAPDADVTIATDSGAADVSVAGNVTVDAAGGACVGQTGWDKDFAKHAYSCGFRSMGNAYRSGRCMAKTQHVSNECGTCIGNLIHCGMKCVRECCYGRCYNSGACVACGDRNCRASFMDCSGVAPPKTGA